MEKGNAYRAADGLCIQDRESFPGYGALSRIKDANSRSPNTIADADHKDSVSDFALWKAYQGRGKTATVKWPRPGPRAEAPGPAAHRVCSAIFKKISGKPSTSTPAAWDLLFPHHENEDAQSQLLQWHDLRAPLVHSDICSSRHDDEQEQGQLLHNSRTRWKRLLARWRCATRC